MFQAPPMKREYLESVTWALRRALGLTDPFLPVPHLVEFGLPRIAKGYEFTVETRASMGNLHGAVDPMARTLALREDVYEGMIDNRGRDRFTACHEIGHAVLHPHTLNRVRPGERVITYCDPEWQANSFASALLMPRHLVAVAGSIAEIVDEFGVSEDAAKVRARILKLRLPNG